MCLLTLLNILVTFIYCTSCSSFQDWGSIEWCTKLNRGHKIGSQILTAKGSVEWV